MSVKMKPHIEYNECLKDSPKFRKYLEREEESIEHLEQKLERTLKLCTGMIDSGKEYVKNQSVFATSLWDLNPHFKGNKSAENALNKIIHCFQEMNKFQTILLDQASFIILKNLTAFVKTDIKSVKDQRTYFIKASETYDAALTRNAQANKNKSVDVSDAVNQLSASSSCFHHMALDYVSAITTLQSKKMHEILSTLLSYYQACNTFYHQGFDMCEDFEEFFKVLSTDIASMQQESNQLCKSLQNRHSSVQKFSENPLTYGASTVTSTPNDSAPNTSNSHKTLDKFEGYLFKRTSNRFKTWNRRWFYINNNQLLYIKREKDETPTIMEEDLKICTVRVYNDSDRRFCFEVISPMKRHTLQADSAEIMHAWITSLHKRINDAILDDRDKVLRSPPLPGAKKFKRLNCEEFYKIPGNDKCCDCGSHEPRWASINLGITLCIACSGVHRSLGVHYSKVRSLTLDAWEPEIVKAMMELGNDVINSIFEANYNDQHTDGDSSSSSSNEVKESQVNRIQRATSDCENSVRELWIKAKYIDKLFVISIDEFQNAKISKTFQNEVSPLNDIIFNGNGWLVQRRRHNKIQLRCEKPIAPDKQSTTDDSASGSEISIDSNWAQDDLSFTSDNESTDGDDDDDAAASAAVRLTNEDQIEDFNCNLLLYRATVVRNLPVMCYAFATGASKNWPNENERCRSPLHQAILSNSVTASEFLILNGSKVNAVDENGYSPLHYATQKGFTALAYLLLKHQAKHDIVANDNKTPIDIAIERANADIVTLLRLTQLNEEIGMEDHGNGEGDTYNDVMNDFSRLTASQH